MIPLVSQHFAAAVRDPTLWHTVRIHDSAKGYGLNSRLMRAWLSARAGSIRDLELRWEPATVVVDVYSGCRVSLMRVQVCLARLPRHEHVHPAWPWFCRLRSTSQGLSAGGAADLLQPFSLASHLQLLTLCVSGKLQPRDYSVIASLTVRARCVASLSAEPVQRKIVACSPLTLHA